MLQLIKRCSHIDFLHPHTETSLIPCVRHLLVPLLIAIEMVRREVDYNEVVLCVDSRTIVSGYQTRVRRMPTGMASETSVTQMPTTTEYPTVL